MNNIDLIIIGNGFDKAFNFDTDWKKYFDFLKENQKYKNCYQLLSIIFSTNQHYDSWSDLEEEMYIFLKGKLNNGNLDDFHIDFLHSAIKEKYESMDEWIKSILKSHKNEIENIKKLFNNWENTYYFSFNYTEQFYDIDSQCKNIHFRTPHREENTSICYFGADYARIRDLPKVKSIEKEIIETCGYDSRVDASEINDELKKWIILINFCCKLSSFNYCKVKWSDNIHTYFRSMYLPKEWCNPYELYLAIPNNVKNAYFLGFGFGNNDAGYNKAIFTNSMNNNGKVYVSTFKNDPTIDKIMNFISNSEQKEYFKNNIKMLTIDEILKILFKTETKNIKR